MEMESCKRAKAPGGECVVDGCDADLSVCREYHRRHKVCEAHSKSPKVSIAGREQRFCQQCSRFHSLLEFDDGKRSCRKRLDGHNRRRRKLPPPAPTNNIFNIPSAASTGGGGTLVSFTSPNNSSSFWGLPDHHSSHYGATATATHHHHNYYTTNDAERSTSTITNSSSFQNHAAALSLLSLDHQVLQPPNHQLHYPPAPHHPSTAATRTFTWDH